MELQLRLMEKFILSVVENASNQNINQVLCFDPSTSQWSTKANMPTAGNGMKLVWFENRIWAIGGIDGSVQTKWKATIPLQIAGKRKLP